jgi:hypothetical protein
MNASDSTFFVDSRFRFFVCMWSKILHARSLAADDGGIANTTSAILHSNGYFLRELSQ